MANPLEQFAIEPIVPITVGPFDLSFTNSSLWMAAAVACSYGLVMAGTRQRALVPGRLQALVELAYEFVAGMVRENAGREGMRYFPWIFTLFMLILFGNLLGIIPGAFTFTSHIIVTFTLALGVFVGTTLVGFALHGWRFLTFFVPPGAPKIMLPLLVPIEILSYCFRPVSLSIRLFVNMMAGHTMLKIFIGFAIALGLSFGWLPFVITVALDGFEIVVAFLQAYIFTVLTCLYLHDAIHLH